MGVVGHESGLKVAFWKNNIDGGTLMGIESTPEGKLPRSADASARAALVAASARQQEWAGYYLLTWLL